MIRYEKRGDDFMNNKQDKIQLKARRFRKLQRDDVGKITYKSFDTCYDENTAPMVILSDVFYEAIENKYSCPLSSKDKIPGFDVNIFVYNPKTKKREGKRWEKCEFYEEFIL